MTVESLSLYDLQNSGQLYKKITAGWDQNQYIAYMAKISGNDLDVLTTFDVENGLWTPNREHDKPYWRNASWVKGRLMQAGYYNDFGFCGTSNFYHWDIVEDERFHSDPYWQLDQCLRLYKEGTPFYGYDHRELSKDYFTL